MAPEFIADLRRADPLASARLRDLRLQARLLQAEGGTCSGAQLARALGISRQAVDVHRARRTPIGLDLGKRGYAFPVWQLHLAGLREILAELREHGPWTQAAFMLTPNIWLDGETPLDALRRGKPNLRSERRAPMESRSRHNSR